jgi:hypothetical protein
VLKPVAMRRCPGHAFSPHRSTDCAVDVQTTSRQPPGGGCRCGGLSGVNYVGAPSYLIVAEHVLARYDADPTPLPAERERLLELLDALHGELRRRVG